MAAVLAASAALGAQPQVAPSQAPTRDVLVDVSSPSTSLRPHQESNVKPSVAVKSDELASKLDSVASKIGTSVAKLGLAIVADDKLLAGKITLVSESGTKIVITPEVAEKITAAISRSSQVYDRVSQRVGANSTSTEPQQRAEFVLNREIGEILKDSKEIAPPSQIRELFGKPLPYDEAQSRLKAVSAKVSELGLTLGDLGIQGAFTDQSKKDIALKTTGGVAIPVSELVMKGLERATAEAVTKIAMNEIGQTQLHDPVKGKKLADEARTPVISELKSNVAGVLQKSVQ